MSTLTRNVEHDREPASEDVPWRYHCGRCHKPYREDGAGGYKPPSGWCPGIKQDSRPKPTGGPKPVSDRAEEKKQSSVTGEVLEFGPVCDWIRDLDCLVADHPDHTCSGPIDPAHLKPRGKGYGDWIIVQGRVELNVGPLCRRAHDELDGRIPNHGGRAQFEREYGIDPRQAVLALQEVCPVEPPEHYRLKAQSDLL